MDVDGQALLPIGVSPIDSLPLLAIALPQITVEARVAGILQLCVYSFAFFLYTFLISILVSFVITPSGESQLHFSSIALAEWSSRYNIPIPLLEDSVDLRQLRSAEVALPPPATADDDDESSEEDEPVWQIKEHAMRK